ncbi:Fanconi anemia group M protein-like [Porphyridium purpureum]|uniref:Fanconi anemia group M protein-like n=1 Tax=Porphyridium purpureum TaxID=35688 RepID=A0A5J4YZW2_PORPP|nr:Fanconi anemia group M protein-like [Porphyridium purpureum]|eukprot:POR9879..scf208_2
MASDADFFEIETDDEDSGNGGGTYLARPQMPVSESVWPVQPLTDQKHQAQPPQQERQEHHTDCIAQVPPRDRGGALLSTHERGSSTLIGQHHAHTLPNTQSFQNQGHQRKSLGLNMTRNQDAQPIECVADMLDEDDWDIDMEVVERIERAHMEQKLHGATHTDGHYPPESCFREPERQGPMPTQALSARSIERGTLNAGPVCNFPPQSYNATVGLCVSTEPSPATPSSGPRLACAQFTGNASAPLARLDASASMQGNLLAGLPGKSSSSPALHLAKPCEVIEITQPWSSSAGDFTQSNVQHHLVTEHYLVQSLEPVAEGNLNGNEHEHELKQTTLDAFVRGRGKGAAAGVSSSPPPDVVFVRARSVDAKHHPLVEATVQDTCGTNGAAAPSSLYAHWIVPSNLNLRPYQSSLAASALGANSLICLPTGLGKTRIASVLILNMVHWFPRGRTLFIAPTRPLITQQRASILDTTGLSPEFVQEVTGMTPAKDRAAAWRSSGSSQSAVKVVVATAQVALNDLLAGKVDASAFVLVVVDEAHRARGNTAACKLVQELMLRTQYTIRVVGLSATPGNSKELVQELVTNLSITRVCCKSETDADVAPYVHARKKKSVVVTLQGHLLGAVLQCALLGESALTRLANLRILLFPVRECFSVLKQQLADLRARNFEPAAMPLAQLEMNRAPDEERKEAYDTLPSLGMIRAVRQRWLETLPPETTSREKYAIEGDFAFLTVWAQLMRTLKTHGIRAIQANLHRLHAGPQTSRARIECCNSPVFRALLSFVDSAVRDGAVHPKVLLCEHVVLDHMRKTQTGTRPAASGGGGDPKGSQSSNVIIFTEFRESVAELESRFAKHRPVVRAAGFVGQANAGSKKEREQEARAMNDDGERGNANDRTNGLHAPRRGMKQREQRAVIEAFHRGEINVLIATCIGEEGLDIGSVDLIVMFDVSRSQVRWIQRMGRTGRTKRGNVVALVTGGAEQKALQQLVDATIDIPPYVKHPQCHLNLYEPCATLLPPCIGRLKGEMRHVFQVEKPRAPVGTEAGLRDSFLGKSKVKAGKKSVWEDALLIHRNDCQDASKEKERGALFSMLSERTRARAAAICDNAYARNKGSLEPFLNSMDLKEWANHVEKRSSISSFSKDVNTKPIDGGALNGLAGTGFFRICVSLSSSVKNMVAQAVVRSCEDVFFGTVSVGQYVAARNALLAKVKVMQSKNAPKQNGEELVDVEEMGDGTDDDACVVFGSAFSSPASSFSKSSLPTSSSCLPARKSREKKASVQARDANCEVDLEMAIDFPLTFAGAAHSFPHELEGAEQTGGQATLQPADCVFEERGPTKHIPRSEPKRRRKNEGAMRQNLEAEKHRKTRNLAPTASPGNDDCVVKGDGQVVLQEKSKSRQTGLGESVLFCKNGIEQEQAKSPHAFANREKRREIDRGRESDSDSCSSFEVCGVSDIVSSKPRRRAGLKLHSHHATFATEKSRRSERASASVADGGDAASSRAGTYNDRGCMLKMGNPESVAEGSRKHRRAPLLIVSSDDDESSEDLALEQIRKLQPTGRPLSISPRKIMKHAPTAHSRLRGPAKASSHLMASHSSEAGELEDEDAQVGTNVDAVLKDRSSPSDSHVSLCCECGLGGLLVCCDACPGALHLECAKPPLRIVPEGEWLCGQCHKWGAKDCGAFPNGGVVKGEAPKMKRKRLIRHEDAELSQDLIVEIADELNGNDSVDSYSDDDTCNLGERSHRQAQKADQQVKLQCEEHQREQQQQPILSGRQIHPRKPILKDDEDDDDDSEQGENADKAQRHHVSAVEGKLQERRRKCESDEGPVKCKSLKQPSRALHPQAQRKGRKRDTRSTGFAVDSTAKRARNKRSAAFYFEEEAAEDSDTQLKKQARTGDQDSYTSVDDCIGSLEHFLVNSVPHDTDSTPARRSHGNSIRESDSPDCPQSLDIYRRAMLTQYQHEMNFATPMNRKRKRAGASRLADIARRLDMNLDRDVQQRQSKVIQAKRLGTEMESGEENANVSVAGLAGQNGALPWHDDSSSSESDASDPVGRLELFPVLRQRLANHSTDAGIAGPSKNHQSVTHPSLHLLSASKPPADQAGQGRLSSAAHREKVEADVLDALNSRDSRFGARGILGGARVWDIHLQRQAQEVKEHIGYDFECSPVILLAPRLMNSPLGQFLASSQSGLDCSGNIGGEALGVQPDVLVSATCGLLIRRHSAMCKEVQTRSQASELLAWIRNLQSELRCVVVVCVMDDQTKQISQAVQAILGEMVRAYPGTVRGCVLTEQQCMAPAKSSSASSTLVDIIRALHASELARCPQSIEALRVFRRVIGGGKLKQVEALRSVLAGHAHASVLALLLARAGSLAKLASFSVQEIQALLPPAVLSPALCSDLYAMCALTASEYALV